MPSYDETNVLNNQQRYPSSQKAGDLLAWEYQYAHKDAAMSYIYQTIDIIPA